MFTSCLGFSLVSTESTKRSRQWIHHFKKFENDNKMFLIFLEVHAFSLVIIQKKNIFEKLNGP